MVFPLALALMGAAGYRKVKQDAVDEEDAAAERTAKREDRAFTVGERARMTKLRDDTALAAAPTTVEDAPVAMPIGSRDEPRAPEDIGIRAAGKTFTNRGEADKAAADYNAEPAVAKRVANVARMGGDFAGSQQILNQSRQGQLADMQLDEAQTTHLNKLFDDNLQRLGSHEAIAAGISESTLGGDMKLKAVPGADGKKVDYQRVNPDGSTTPTGYSFTNDSRGILEAKQVMSRLTPVAQKLEYLHKQTVMEQTVKHQDATLAQTSKHQDATVAETGRHNQAMEKIGGDNTAARIEIASMRAGIAADARAAKAASLQPATATPEASFDSKTAADIAKDQVQKEADEARATGKVWSAQQMATRKDAIVQALFQQHTVRFVESAVTRALGGSSQDPAAYAVAYEQAQQVGVPIKRLAELGFKPPARAAAPVQPGQAPRAQGQAPATQGPAAGGRLTGTTIADLQAQLQGGGAPAQTLAAPAAPAAQGQPMVEQKVPFQQFVAQNITTPAGKQAIAQRIQKELPDLQRQINGDTQVMALPMVSGAVKARLKARIDAAAQEAQMMQAFIAGNPGV